MGAIEARASAAICAGVLCGLVGSASGQMGARLGAAHAPALVAHAPDGGESARMPLPLVASLSYDGSSSWGFMGQDFEAALDAFDVAVCEPFGIAQDSFLSEFRSRAFGTGNPFGVQDIVVEIYRADQLADLCDDDVLPAPIARSTLGAGFYDGQDAVTDLGGVCLPAGDYVLRFFGELDSSRFGEFFFFSQHGAHDNGLGTPDDGFFSMPTDAFGRGHCFPTVDGGDGTRSGVNFQITGENGTCGGCPDVNACGDWDDDGDSDSDDFFGYLASFSGGDPCADLNGDGSFDATDFFAYLDRFVSPC